MLTKGLNHRLPNQFFTSFFWYAGAAAAPSSNSRGYVGIIPFPVIAVAWYLPVYRRIRPSIFIRRLRVSHQMHERFPSLVPANLVLIVLLRPDGLFGQ